MTNETREYSRDSFDRFNDYLCGDLLRYVSTIDCFAFECISKQFQRSVFRGVKKLDTKPLFDSLGLDSEDALSFECVLKKCLFINEMIIGNVSKINIKIVDSIIDTIREHCSQLASISMYGDFSSVSPNTWQLFGEKFGDSLRRIAFNNSYRNQESMKTLLKFTPNLVECGKLCDINDITFKTDFRSEREHVLPKLKKVTAFFGHWSDFHSFADIYSDRLESIILTKNCLKKDVSTDMILKQFARFHRLEVLAINDMDFGLTDYFGNGLDLLAKNCQTLRELYLESNSSNFNGIRHRFVSLRRLTIHGFAVIDRYIHFNVSDLSCCPNLTSLEVIVKYGSLSGDHFADIHLHLPKLQRFELNVRGGVEKPFLESLALLKDLYLIKVNVKTMRETDTELRNFINLSKSIRKININSITSISRQTVDEFVSIAKRSQRCYNYCLRVNVLNGDESVGDNDIEDITSGLPKNININITAKHD